MQILVDELPKSCKTCQFQCYGECRNGCDILKTDYSMTQCHIMRGKYKDCPLIDIKTHDRALVNEVCEKIREFCENNKYRCNKYFLLYSIGLNVKLLNKNKEGQKETFYEFLDQIQKEFEDGE